MPELTEEQMYCIMEQCNDWVEQNVNPSANTSPDEISLPLIILEKILKEMYDSQWSN